MLLDLLYDGHVHTRLCRHATGEMEEYVQGAIKKGLRGMCFLEHLEEGIRTPRKTWLSDGDFDNYFAEGHRLRNVYGDRIDIDLGIEVGYNPDCRERIAARLAQWPYDRLGISCHFLRLPGADDHFNVVSKSDPRLYRLSLEEATAIQRAYYRTLTEAVTVLQGSVVCHFDGVLRYYPGLRQLERPWDLIEELLEAIKRKEMAIELNTSGFAIGTDAYPGEAIRARARALQIPLQAASDAHKPDEVGRFFERLNKPSFFEPTDA